MRGNQDLYFCQNIDYYLYFIYRDQPIFTRIPKSYFTESFFTKLFSPEILSKIITQENSSKLQSLLPNDIKNIITNPNELSSFLLNTKTKFYTPINNFYQKYLHNFFTQDYQKRIPYFYSENLSDYIEKKEIIYNELKKVLDNLNNNNNNSSNNNNEVVTFDMHSELASSGYTSIDLDKDSKPNSPSKKNSQYNLESNLNNINNINDDISNNKKNNLNEKNKQNILNNPHNLFLDHSSENDDFIDRNILLSERFKNIKKNKIQITIKPRTKEEIEQFRKQEEKRYENPLLPWEYKLSNGNIAIVAPLFNNQKLTMAKARDHELLKTKRPPYITLLALVRDAAARLEDGVGTRLDICELLKDSQYINDNIPNNKINSIVSGALDRLHYQKDPCVKYDSHNKLWIYLHRNRSLDFPGWKKVDDNNAVQGNNNNNNIVIEDDSYLNDDDNNGKNKSKKKKEEGIDDDGGNGNSDEDDGKMKVVINEESDVWDKNDKKKGNNIGKGGVLGKKRAKKEKK